MTEAGRKWIETCRFGDDGVGDVEDYSFLEEMEKDAEFWIRAFCEAVEKNTDEWVGKSLGAAFIDIKRDLLGG